MTSLPKGEGGVAVDVVVESPCWRDLPEAEQVVGKAIAQAASYLSGRSGAPVGPAPVAAEVRARLEMGEVAVLLCDDGAIAALNGRWRGHTAPTNVLSFPAPPSRSPQSVPLGNKIPLGDIAIAWETVMREAAEQGKAVADHLAHLVVHGFLHLLGYDHHIDDEAEDMERIESAILAKLGVADPYAFSMTEDGRGSAEDR
jgi:probable rRNA maturation factor